MTDNNKKIENKDQPQNGGQLEAGSWEFTPNPGTPREKAWDEFSRFSPPNH